MKDIDFDELDRAVSSVLSQKKPSDGGAAPASLGSDDKKETVSVTNNTPVPVDDGQTIAPTDQTDHSDATVTTPEPASPGSTEHSDQPEIVTPSTASAPPLAVKRRGKFMDVMHPSHDMAPGSPAPAALPASKPKHLLGPVSQDMKSDENNSQASDAKPEPISTPVEAVVNKPEPQPQVELPADKGGDVEKKPTSLYIDPLELDDKSNDVKPDEKSVEAEEPSSDETTPETPQTTPFLSDAKVEKRPLGGFTEPEAVTTAPETSPAAETLDEQPANNQVAPSVPLPRELQPDVVKVEAVNDDTRPPVNEAAGSESAKPAVDQPKPSAENEKTQSHPLFDTSTYHEPTAAKGGGKKPGWLMWVVGFAICLAIGGGVGYFLFTAGF